MVPTSVKYLPEVQNGEKLKTRNSQNDIQRLYLKTTIVVLTLALVTISALLVWQLLKKKHSCRQDLTQSKDNLLYSKSGTQSPYYKANWQCPPVIKENLLPYGLPAIVKKILKDVGSSLKQEVEKKRLVSMSSSAFYRDVTVWKAGFGVIDKSSYPEQTPNEDTLYRSGSVALMTFKLLQHKKIDCLDDPLQKYASKFSVKNPFNKNAITIRQILSHTSGLPREVPCGQSFSSKRKNICPVNTTYVSEQLRQMKLKFAPGTSVGYSNLGYALLAHALFERFGSLYGSWKEWVSHELLIPLGMTNTVLDNKRYYGNVAVSYKNNDVITPILNWGWSSPAFQIFTSTADLTKLMKALLNSEDSIFYKHIVRQMFNPVFVFPDGNTMFTSGWQVQKQNSLFVVSKAGTIPGSSSAIFLIPEFRFGFCLLTTGQEIASKLALEISNKITKAFVSSSVGLSLEIKSAPIAAIYTGNYILDSKWSDPVRAIISIEAFSGLLKLRQEPGYPPVTYLSFINSQQLQIVYPRGLSCQVYALGQDKEFLWFQRPDSTGRFQQFTLGSFVFNRVP